MTAGPGGQLIGGIAVWTRCGLSPSDGSARLGGCEGRREADGGGGLSRSWEGTHWASGLLPLLSCEDSSECLADVACCRVPCICVALR